MPTKHFSKIMAIQTAYPTPRKEQDADGSERSYCVGGALCLYAGTGVVRVPFPNNSELSIVLLQTNKALPIFLSFRFAETITMANDLGEYEDAWRYLEEALTWSLDQTHGWQA